VPFENVPPYIDQPKPFARGGEHMAFIEDDKPKKRLVHEIGQDLSTLSVEDLKARIALLQGEIGRIEVELGSKGKTMSAAEALFKRS
jgi:uncharacterized small protein (DUF1192 family)